MTKDYKYQAKLKIETIPFWKANIFIGFFNMACATIAAFSLMMSMLTAWHDVIFNKISTETKTIVTCTAAIGGIALLLFLITLIRIRIYIEKVK